MSITIRLVSIMVDDQAKALDFYTGKLGFEKRADVAAGDYRWLTVTAPAGSPDIELVLEPNQNPAGRTFQAALYEQGIPATAFFTDDLDAEHKRLADLGVQFVQEPKEEAWGKHAVLDDTCGNLIQLQEVYSYKT
jgi:catechol 2,3-dioxygenase-like lactoylglutathione lyase family enzyme